MTNLANDGAASSLLETAWTQREETLYTALFVDLGPVFDDWEADFGRTFVLGDDPMKQALRRDLPLVWQELRAFYEADPDMTGAVLYAEAHRAAERRGWTFGGGIKFQGS